MTYNTKTFVKAVKGSGGIITTIAERVGCCWNTAKKYIDTHPTVAKAYQDECEKQLDKAEGVVFGNIEIAEKIQVRGKQADTSDAKWYLSRKGKQRGYVERQEISGPGGKDLVINLSWGEDADDSD